MRLRGAAVVLACVTGAGCGGSDTGDRPLPPRLSAAEQAAGAVRRQMQAVARGDGGTACGLLSPKALEAANRAVSRRGADLGCATAIEQGAGGLPPSVLGALRRPAITRVEVRGDRARVRVRLAAGVRPLAGGREEVTLPLRRLDGRWRVDGLPL